MIASGTKIKAATSTLVLSVTALLALGIVMLYSSSMADKGGSRQVEKQMIWCVMGLIGCLIAANIDYRLLKRHAWVILGFAAVVLLMVFVPHVGARINGARRWIKLGGDIRFEPSELGKLALIIAVAKYGEHYQRQLGTFKRGVLMPALLIGGFLGLIFVEPDRGTTILLMLVAGAMLFIAGARWKYIVPLLILVAAGFLLSLHSDAMRSDRIRAWLNPEQNKNGVGYQTYQGLLALGSGGWWGLGLGNSREKLGFLPEQTTDFIFPIIGEELGLVATLLVVVAFIIVLTSGAYIASHADDTFGVLLGFGITFLIGIQAFINIGVVTNTLPNKGMPLPFISKGGSNLLIMLTSIGILLSIARRVRSAGPDRDAELEPGRAPVPQPV
jgi:cell division protein FtsW